MVHAGSTEWTETEGRLVVYGEIQVARSPWLEGVQRSVSDVCRFGKNPWFREKLKLSRPGGASHRQILLKRLKFEEAQ
jgi:hypothetical protein